MKNLNLEISYNTPDFKINFIHGGIQMIYIFINGYEASVVQHDFSYGGKDNLWEIAVRFKGQIVYDTPITADVLGHLHLAEVADVLAKIADLPPRAEDAPHPSESRPNLSDIMEKW